MANLEEQALLARIRNGDESGFEGWIKSIPARSSESPGVWSATGKMPRTSLRRLAHVSDTLPALAWLLTLQSS